ncbi:hypothetical protein [Stappia indica]|uniref:hypothetical protein n=1 Tax=Stappia indica TaxID=538381 RepID=UPI001CD2528F|nr:hypothetical protein [Stappia indica]MCA1298537.1 hypothetical protein [Stappia indica]
MSLQVSNSSEQLTNPEILPSNTAGLPLPPMLAPTGTQSFIYEKTRNAIRRRQRQIHKRPIGGSGAAVPFSDACAYSPVHSCGKAVGIGHERLATCGHLAIMSGNHPDM